MKISCFTVGMFQVNTYLLTDPTTGQSAIVDTGESRELIQRLGALDPKPDVRCILLTHAHVDHAGALKWLQEVYDVPTYLGRLERPLFEALPQQGDWFGMPMLNRPCGRIDHWVDDGFELELGASRVRFFSTPGHTPGQGCWIADDDIVVGDTIFAGSIGRTDFPMSSPRAMRETLHRLMTLPLHLRVHSGHGPVTTLERELASNPFLAEVRRARAAAATSPAPHEFGRSTSMIDREPESGGGHG